MKKVLSTLLVMLLLIGTLAACAEAPEPEETTHPTEMPTTEETPEPDPPTEPDVVSNPQSENEEETATTFTLQQIENALKPQLDFGQERLIDWEVVSAERIGINPAGTMLPFEPAATDIDISGSVRYSVTIRWANEPNDPWDGYWDDWSQAEEDQDGFLINPGKMRDSRFGTTETRDWDFFIAEGKPELVFVVC